jgi:hypothetical protein
MIKTYQQQCYPVTVKVRVTYHGCWADGGHSFTDHIKGLNSGHALYLAGLNWPSAKTITLERGV